jgi:DNA-binding NarL/FixJ family response regulator
MHSAVEAVPQVQERRLRVLIIDDSRHFLSAAKALVEMMPRVAFVATASSGEAGLALASSGTFDLVILDLSMDGMNGLEVARRMRLLACAPTIVLVSLHDVPEFRDAAHDVGVAEFIPKPALAGQMEHLLERMFGAR